MKQLYTQLADDGSGDLMLVLNEDIMTETGWQIGDTLQWIDNKDNTFTLQKLDLETKNEHTN